jgi:hypothetical protein
VSGERLVADAAWSGGCASGGTQLFALSSTLHTKTPPSELADEMKTFNRVLLGVTAVTLTLVVSSRSFGSTSAARTAAVLALTTAAGAAAPLAVAVASVARACGPNFEVVVGADQKGAKWITDQPEAG